MAEMRISAIIIGERVRKDMGDIDSLAKSMVELGLLHPVVVTPDNRLIAGARRIEAAKKLGWTEIKASVHDINSIVQGERAENEIRKDFTYSERLRIAEMVKKEIDKGHGGSRRGKNKQVHDRALEKSRHVAAVRAGLVSHGTYQRVRRVVEEGSEELIQAMDSGKLTPFQACKQLTAKTTTKTPHVSPRITNRPTLRSLSSEETGRPVGADALEPDPDCPTVTKAFSHIAKHGHVQIFSLDDKRRLDFGIRIDALTSAIRSLAKQTCPTESEWQTLLTDKQQNWHRRHWDSTITTIRQLCDELETLNKQKVSKAS